MSARIRCSTRTLIIDVRVGHLIPAKLDAVGLIPLDCRIGHGPCTVTRGRVEILTLGHNTEYLKDRDILIGDGPKVSTFSRIRCFTRTWNILF